MGDLTKNFSRSEFACKCGCGKDNISLDLVDRLQHARDSIALPFHISSGVRCEKHNRSIGGEPTSAHLYGLAVDLLCPVSEQRFRILQDFIRRFRRIGISNEFIHVDIDETKPQSLVWLY